MEVFTVFYTVTLFMPLHHELKSNMPLVLQSSRDPVADYFATKAEFLERCPALTAKVRGPGSILVAAGFSQFSKNIPKPFLTDNVACMLFSVSTSEKQAKTDLVHQWDFSIKQA